MDENYHEYSSETTSESQISQNNLERKTDYPDFCFYNMSYQNKESQEKLPTLEPSLSFTVDAKRNAI